MKCFVSFSNYSKYLLEKIILSKKCFVMKKKEFKRINLWVEPTLYNQIKENADDLYLKIATYVRQLIQQAMKNKIIK